MMDHENDRHARAQLIRTHLLWGWGQLLLFAFVGVGLELLLAYKVTDYVDAHAQTRRLLFRLGHAHGTLIALVQLAFVATLPHLNKSALQGSAPAISKAFRASAVLIPAGFLLGGLGAHGGDPGPLIALLPAGALLFLFACGKLCRVLSQRDSEKNSSREKEIEE